MSTIRVLGLVMALFLGGGGRAENPAALPFGASVRLGTLRFRHAGFVHALAFTPDGKNLISASQDQTIFWDLDTGKEIRRFPKGIRAISPSGRTLALGWNLVHIVDRESGKELLKVGQQDVSITSAAFSPDGKYLVTGGDEKIVRVWRLADGREIRQFKGHQDRLKSVAFSRDSKTILSLGGHVDNTPILWDLASGKQKLRLNPGVSAAVLMPDGASLFIARGTKLVLQDIQTGKIKNRYHSCDKGIQVMAVAQNGRLLACATAGNTIQIWDTVAMKKIRWLPWFQEGVGALAFSPNGKILAAAGGGYTIRLWDTGSGRELFPDGHQGTIDFLAFSRDGKTVISHGRDDTIRLWDRARGKERKRSDRRQDEEAAWWGGGDSSDFVAGSADGRILALGNGGGTLRILNTVTGNERPLEETGYPVALSRDGNLLVALKVYGHGKNIIKLWNLSGNQKIRSFQLRKNGQIIHQDFGLCCPICLAPDGKTLAIAWFTQRNAEADIEDLGINIWDVEKGKELGRIDHLSLIVTHLAFSPNGKILVYRQPDGSRHFWDIQGKDSLRKFHAAKGWGPFLGFSPDGKTFVTGGDSRDPTVYLWETATGLERRRFQGHVAEIWCIAFSPDGRSLATGSSDTTILLWELAKPPSISMVDSKVQAKSRPQTKATLKELESWWTDLGGLDAAKAYRAIWSLAVVPKEAVPFLKSKLSPAPIPDAKKMAGWIKDLASDQYPVRERASNQLEKLGELAEPALKKALAAHPPLEVQRRLEKLRARLHAPVSSPEVLRGIRAVETLEYIGNAEAREVLRRLAQGAAGARLTEEAKESLERLERRKN